MQVLDPEIVKAISRTISIGPGHMTNFAVNGKLVQEELTWEQYCVVDSNYGGCIADNKVVHCMQTGDTWSCDNQTNTIVLNCVDPSLLTENVERLKKRNRSEKVIFTE